MLLEAADAAYLLVSAVSQPLAEGIVEGIHTAVEYGIQTILDMPDREWVLGMAIAMYISLVISENTNHADPRTLDSLQTPYTLLGVSTRSSRREINMVYQRARQTAANASQLAAYEQAYEILTDRLQRCIYHRDTGIPDWYGVPMLCWVEKARARLKAAKRRVEEAWDSPFDELYESVRKLAGGLPDPAANLNATTAQSGLAGSRELTSCRTLQLWADQLPLSTISLVLALLILPAVVLGIYFCCAPFRRFPHHR
ncbi:176c6778-aea7-4249-9c9f-3992945227ae [Thermothielavioides terrestris]|uniref:176c6778-aea7-4249-9c9f-3992945227ae n=1 Tax=Thermothielavioides terrestris TaxID=2587410 RepID=A0A3S4AYF0_9PEZI|nr:176c6778-aea7-4249-9c9f-3992945227ae [Thermothielavioides terrestris]